MSFLSGSKGARMYVVIRLNNLFLIIYFCTFYLERGGIDFGFSVRSTGPRVGRGRADCAGKSKVTSSDSQATPSKQHMGILFTFRRSCCGQV